MDVNLGTVRTFALIDATGMVKGREKAEQQLRGLTASMKTAADHMRSLGQAMTIGLTLPLVALGKSSVDAAVKMDSLKRGLTAVTGSSKEAERQLVRLKEVAKLPGLGFREAIQGSINLQAAGLSARMAERSLMAFGNALATVGKGKAELDGVNLALTQIAAKGKVSAEEINQLQERLPQIRQLMRDAFGSADTEVLAKRGIGSDTFITKIIESLEKLPKVSGGAQNAMENFADSLDAMKVAIGESILPMLTRTMDMLEPKVKAVAEWFKRLTPEAKNFVTTLGVGLAAGGPVLLGFSALIGALGNVKAALITIAALPAFAWLAKGAAAAANPVALGLGFLFAPQSAGEGGDLSLAQRFPKVEDQIKYLEKNRRELMAKIKATQNQPMKIEPPKAITGLQGLDETLRGMGFGDKPNAQVVDKLADYKKGIKDIDDALAALQSKQPAGAKKPPILNTGMSDAALKRMEQVRDRVNEIIEQTMRMTTGDMAADKFLADLKFAEDKKLVGVAKASEAYQATLDSIADREIQKRGDMLHRMQEKEEEEADRVKTMVGKFGKSVSEAMALAHAGAAEAFNRMAEQLNAQRVQAVKDLIQRGMATLAGGGIPDWVSDARSHISRDNAGGGATIPDLELVVGFITDQFSIAEAIKKAQRLKAEINDIFREGARVGRDILVGAFEGLLLGTRDIFGQILDDLKRLVVRMIAELASTKLIEAVGNLFGGGKGGEKKGGGFFGSLMGLIPGGDILGGLLGGLLGGGEKKGGGGVGGMLGQLGGAISGLVFDNAANDAKAFRWGRDFGSHFSKGALEGGGRMRPVAAGSGMTQHFHIGGTFHVREEADIKKISREIAWQAQQRGRVRP